MTVPVIIAIALGIALLLFCVYVFALARPKARPPKNTSLLCEYTHRGLYGGKIPENSLAAFALACEKGYAIELDVQLSADKEVMVFHDPTLERMTGNPAKLSELTCDELRKLKLGESEEHIPTLREVLELVSGRTPLLIELKGENLDTSLCPRVAEILRGYSGEYCIESFNPLLVSVMRRQLPDAYYGLLYTNVCREKKKYSVLNFAISCMALNVVARPDFIAFDKKYRDTFPVWLTTRFFKAPKYVWTIRGDEELKVARECGEYAIFEACESKFK